MAWQEEKQETGPGPPLGTSMGREPAISHSLKGEEDIAVHVASTVLHETSLVRPFVAFLRLGTGASWWVRVRAFVTST